MWETLKNELMRVWPLIAIALLTAFFLGEHAQFAVQMYRLSMVSLVIISAHMIRKALFPYIDLEIVSDMAGMTPVGAGLVFIGVIGFIVSVILAAGIFP